MAFNIVETAREGAAGIREIQTLSIGPSCTGTYTLDGQTVNAGDSVAAVQAAVDATPSLTTALRVGRIELACQYENTGSCFPEDNERIDRTLKCGRLIRFNNCTKLNLSSTSSLSVHR